MIAREVLGWDRFGAAGRELAQSIAADGYRPDAILAIARGGLLLAGTLSYALEVKSVHLLNVVFYTGVDERLAEPLVLDPEPDLSALAGRKVLIVDDVADTGGTLRMVQERYAGRLGESRTAVLYEKPPSVVKCDYVWRHTDMWITFPWSSLPPVVG